MSIVRVAAVQYAVTEDVSENLVTGLRMAVTLDGPFVAALADRARRHGIHLMANCTVAREDGRTTGSNILLGPDGSILGVTDKQVLMGSERDHLDPAVAPSPIIDVSFGRVGLYSCMDGVINETPRLLGVGGAQVLLNSLNSFALDEASLHVPVRAVENRVWVVAANKVGPLVPERSIGMVAERVGVPVEMLHGAGEAQIVAPDGTVVAIAPRTGEAVVVADIEVAEADDKRRPDGTDVMASRRPDLYGPILEAPRGRQRPAGADELVTAVVSPVEGDDVSALLAEALASGAALVVLPELAGLDADAIVASLAGSDALVATSVADGAQHVGLVLSADGVVLRQAQLHACARHGWSTELGKGLEVADLPWGRLALVVGDDALYPETFRLAALQDVDVVAVPFTVQAAADLDPLLLERAAENRLNVAVASPRTPYGGGALYPLSTDFTLWAPGRGPFSGVISRPDPVLATAAVEVATLRPACATNRFVSKGTDVVDGRPWDLAAALVAPVSL